MSIFFTLILWVFAFSVGQNIDTAVSYYCFHFISWGVGGGGQRRLLFNWDITEI